MERKPTVAIEPVENHPNAVRLKWQRWVVEGDVRPAFRELTRYLDSAKQPIHVLVDLRSDPRLPLQTTIYETISGPFLHPNMGKWLVIGKNQRAQIVADVITRVGLRNSILWFKTEEEALEKLTSLEAGHIQAWE